MSTKQEVLRLGTRQISLSDCREANVENIHARGKSGKAMVEAAVKEEYKRTTWAWNVAQAVPEA